MQQEIIKTKKPTMVLQVFHNFLVYHKDMKSYLDRKNLTQWKDVIHSKSAYLEDGKLTLSESQFHPNILNSDLLILNDFNANSESEIIKNQSQKWTNNLIDFEKKSNGQVFKKLKYVQYFNLKESPKKFEIFRLNKVNDKIELHLCYDLHEIGQPKRDNFKLCDLEINIPIEVKINGKLDHSLSSGRERKYIENGFIFHLIGKINTFEFTKEPFNGTKKSIPKPLKTINLMKELY